MLFYFACEAAGASAPGIPHALLGERWRILAQLGRIQRRENADTRAAHAGCPDRHSPLATYHPSSPRTRGPITTGSSFAIDCIEQHLSTRAARRMGPCVRRDDTEVITATATHHSPLTIRRPRARGDPVTTGSSFTIDVVSTRASRRMGPCVRRDDADVITATATHGVQHLAQCSNT